MATYSSYSCLENSMDRGAWWATIHGVAELDTTDQLTLPLDFSFIPKSRKFDGFQAEDT